MAVSLNQLSNDVQELIKNISESENLKNTSIDVSEATAKGENFLGSVYRVRVEDKNQKKVLNFIIKCAPIEKTLRETTPVALYYNREIEAYKKILPTLYSLQEKYDVPENERFSYAKYYGSIDEEEKETIILQDMCHKGFKMYNKKKSFDRQHFELTIRTLAQFHATSFVLKKMDVDLFKSLTHMIAKGADYGKHVRIFLDAGKKVSMKLLKDSEIRKKAEDHIGNIYEKLQEYYKYERTEPYNVICHGDCWINNMLFKYKDDCVKEMKFIDFQISRLATPIMDLAYMIFSCTDERIRSNHYESMLDLYYETLEKNVTQMQCKMSECYPIEVYKNQIKSTMPMGLIITILVTPVMLSDKSDSLDLEEMSPEELDDSMFAQFISESYIERLNGVARDCLKYSYI